MANTCPVCGGKLGLLNREKSADGLICASCSNFFFSKLGIRAAKQPTAALADYWATLEQRRKVFKETDSIYDGDALFVSIDKTNRLFCFGHRGGDKGPRMIYSFDEVAGYESDAPDDLTVTETKGGIGRAVIGAAVAGPVGADRGRCYRQNRDPQRQPQQRKRVHPFYAPSWRNQSADNGLSRRHDRFSQEMQRQPGEATGCHAGCIQCC